MGKYVEMLKDRCEKTSEIQEAWNILYDTRVGDYFNRVKELDLMYRKPSTPISDSDLESILTELPLILFSVSEILNQVKLEFESIKIENKKLKVDYANRARDEISRMIDEGINLSASQANQYIDNYIVSESTNDNIVVKIYETVISRVENEISFTKELIMSCKKIWDSRRQSEQSNPIGEVVPDLPDYNQVNVATVRNNSKSPSDYIK